MMCTEKESITVTYKVMRRHGRRLRPTGHSRTAPASRTKYTGWMVYHDGRWRQLKYDDGFYIEVKR